MLKPAAIVALLETLGYVTTPDGWYESTEAACFEEPAPLTRPCFAMDGPDTDDGVILEATTSRPEAELVENSEEEFSDEEGSEGSTATSEAVSEADQASLRESASSPSRFYPQVFQHWPLYTEPLFDREPFRTTSAPAPTDVHVPPEPDIDPSEERRWVAYVPPGRNSAPQASPWPHGTTSGLRTPWLPGQPRPASQMPYFNSTLMFQRANMVLASHCAGAQHMPEGPCIATPMTHSHVQTGEAARGRRETNLRPTASEFRPSGRRHAEASHWRPANAHESQQCVIPPQVPSTALPYPMPPGYSAYARAPRAPYPQAMPPRVDRTIHRTDAQQAYVTGPWPQHNASNQGYSPSPRPGYGWEARQPR
jgi:hypothetical protein